MTQTKLSPVQLRENFADLHPTYTRDEAVAEASKCLYCYDAPCTRACPTHIDVPRFIRQILHQNVAGAAETILDANIFGGACARACPTEVLCEGACVDQARAGMPIEIGRLQRYATDYALERGFEYFEAGTPTGKRVAIIGSGPSGLSCAHMLRRLGHETVVFEARDVPGGLNTIGIAPYKLDRETSLREIGPILKIGIDLRLNTPIDGPTLSGMLDEYDAVFVGVGLGVTQRLNIPGEDAPGVQEALSFIYRLHREPYEKVEVGNRVVVIGCGNTAIDAATGSKRLGAANVTIAYRRSDAEMSAYQYEYAHAKHDGISFEWHASPVEFVTTDGRLSGVKFIRTRFASAGDGSRQAKLEEIPGSEFIVPCDMALKALGQSPVLQLLADIEGVEMSGRGLKIDPETCSTTRPGLFAGGDCTSSGAEIVNAVQDGKMAARSIHRYLCQEGA
jgi:glutamate synthase (NADPH/NADH) small chain